MHFFISFNFHLKYFLLQKIIILTINVSKSNEILCIFTVFQTIHNMFEFILFKFKSIRKFSSSSRSTLNLYEI